MNASLPALTWIKLQVDLLNTRNQYAREHPLAVFDAVFRHAARGCLEDATWFLHPASAPAKRVHKGRASRLEAVFVGTTTEAVGQFVRNLETRLADPRNNFEIQHCSAPLHRSPAALLAEHPFPSGGLEEVCLEFHTPLAFTPPDPRRRWMISREQLFESLSGRLESLFGVDLRATDADLAGVDLLPWYWHYEEHRHAGKSAGGWQYINGCAGPLYLKGAIEPLWPLLVLGTELHAGREMMFGQGAYALRANRPYFDALISEASRWMAAHAEAAGQSDQPDAFLHPMVSARETIESLLQEIRAGTYTPAPAKGFRVAKKGGTDGRLLALMDSRDKLVHSVLHKTLAPVLDLMFEDSSQAFRPGRSLAGARQAILKAVKEDCQWAVESDIAAFFDELDWEILDGQLRRCLPASDHRTLDLILRAIRMPMETDGEPAARTRGVLQGSPLSPLMANVYLDSFDESAHRAGMRLVRYADDFMVLCKSRDEAEAALVRVRELLVPLKLGLKDEKTAITPLASGWHFLGMDFGPQIDEEFVERATLRKTVFVREQWAFVGLDGDTLTLRNEGVTKAKVPLSRVGELVVLGNNGVSSRLVQRCMALGVPLSFCTSSGYFVGTVRPDSREYFERCGRHLARREAQPTSEALQCAARIVSAKLWNYRAWIRESRAGDDKKLADILDGILARVDAASTVEELRGLEGEGARAIFRRVNDLVSSPEFRTERRERRARQDPYNSLLDFCYSLLFNRINAMLRSRGLNPYLGWLHSPADRYESLVCDLEEPFRCRVDRFVVNLIQREQVKMDSFERKPDGRLTLKSEFLGGVIQAWESEQRHRYATDPGSLEQLLHAQICAIEAWIINSKSPMFYRACPTPSAPGTPNVVWPSIPVVS